MGVNMTEFELELLTKCYEEVSAQKQRLLKSYIASRSNPWDTQYYREVLQGSFPDKDVYGLSIRDFITNIEAGESEYFSSITIENFTSTNRAKVEEYFKSETPIELVDMRELLDVKLVATTHDVCLEDVNFNKFRVSTSLRQYLRRDLETGISSIHPIVPLKPIDGNYPHPHIRNTTVCYGEGLDVLNKYVRSANFVSAMVTLGGILYTYNGGSPYKRLDAYRSSMGRLRVKCTDCGSEDIQTPATPYCNSCRRYTCRDCTLRKCPNCTRNVCYSCMLKDPLNDVLFCGICKYTDWTYGSIVCLGTEYSISFSNRENMHTFNNMDNRLKNRNALRKKVKSIPGYLDTLQQRRFIGMKPLYVPLYTEYDALSQV